MGYCGKKGFFFSVLLILATVSSGVAQYVSNEGREFWLSFPRHEPSNQSTANIRLFITAKSASRGQVKIGNASIPFTVVANGMSQVDIPRSLAYVNDAGTFSGRGIQVLVDTSQPKVTVFAHIYALDRSAAAAILPLESLGSKYYVMGYDQHGPAAGMFTYSIVATAPNTTVLIHQMINQVRGSTISVTLNAAGDVYQFLGTDDYTGTYVEADPTSSLCKTFAVFAGSSGVTIPYANDASLNPLYQQLYSVNNWGKNFAYVPLNGPDLGDVLRVLAQEDNTQVLIDGVPGSINLDKGNFYTSAALPTPRMIYANKPISVAQFALSQRYSDTRNIALGPGFNGQFPVFSDPTMLVLNPTEWGSKDVSVYATGLVGISRRFINVVMRTSAASTFKVNGGIPVGASFTPIGTSAYSYMQLDVARSPYNMGMLSVLHLTADEGFRATSYGFADYNCYAYEAGTNISSEFTLTATDHLTGLSLNSACRNQLVDFKLSIPYITTDLEWKLDATLPVISQINPSYTTVVRAGETFFEYDLPGIIFSTSGTKEIKVSAKLPVITAGCNNGFKDLNFDFRVNDIPIANFGAVSESCMREPVVFSDASQSSDSPLTQWFWDFGDGAVTSTRNPTHTYNAAGNFQVTLRVTSASGCSASFVKFIHVLALPQVSFTTSSAVCQNTAISFTDTSISTDGAIVRWNWDFGDGGTSSLQHPSHTYTRYGLYTVRLTTATDNGCKSVEASRIISVNALPEVSFQKPKICFLDALAYFVNTTTIADGTDASLRYLWDFGDALATSSNPTTSTLKNPSHIYSAQGAYTITLRVQSNNNCTITLIEPFLVNGNNPQADFTVLNQSGNCSAEPVLFEDKSTADFGELVRIEWYYDWINDPTNKEVDDQPNLRADVPKQYSHLYPTFHSPLIKTYTVKMMAYSGQACVSEKTQVVSLKAVPEVEFGAVSGVCVDKVPFQLVAREISAFQGSGQFSGPGVSASGLFDPALAGAGLHVVTYTFTGLNNCASAKTQTIIVYPLPQVDAGLAQVLLRGESIRLEGKVRGRGVTYKWSPSVWLSQDDILNPIASPEENITYTLTAMSADGCSNVSSVFLKILQVISMSNVFTPNSDGIEDGWVIKNLDMYPGATVRIYDRYGSEVYHSKEQYVPWNGKKENGEDLPLGTYYYYIDPKNRRSPISGYVVLLR